MRKRELERRLTGYPDLIATLNERDTTIRQQADELQRMLRMLREADAQAATLTTELRPFDDWTDSALRAHALTMAVQHGTDVQENAKRFYRFLSGQPEGTTVTIGSMSGNVGLEAVAPAAKKAAKRIRKSAGA